MKKISKSNKKARQIRDFELATTGIIYHPPLDVVKAAEQSKKQDRRERQRKLNIAKFKRE